MVEGARLLRVGQPVPTAIVLDLNKALFNVDVGRAVLAHRAELDEVACRGELLQREEYVEVADNVVVLRVKRVPPVDHRVGRGALLGEVDDCLRAMALHDAGEELPVQQVTELDRYRLAAYLLPRLHPLFYVGERREAMRPELVVYLPADAVVDYHHLVAGVGEVQGGRPATAAGPAKDQDLHTCAP